MRETKASLKIFALVLVILMIAPISLSVQTSSNGNNPVETHETAAFAPANILFDESHTANGSSLWAPGNASLFSWMLGVNGYNSSTNFNQSLDTGVLNGFDTLVLFFPMIDLTQAEVDAIHNFVTNGGGLLLVGVDTGNWWDFTSERLNVVSETYGITFNADQLRGTTTSFSTHDLTNGVDGIMVDADQLWSCSLTLSGSAESIVTLDSKTIVATAESGSGRVVAVGTPAPFLMYRARSMGYGASHFQFSLNVIDWLTKNTIRDANVPDVATIIVGNGPQVDVTEYEAFAGLYHDHTTHSDGQNTVEEMVEAGLNNALDFMVLTDHSYDKPVAIGGMTGGAAARKLCQQYGIYIEQIPGAELSTVKHTTGFPLKYNVFTSDQQEAVDGIHAQGAIATFAHPTIDPSYAPVYEAFDTYGFDAVEVDNKGFFYGGGEDGFFRNFLGASDGHQATYVGQMTNFVFVKNPSGPDGRINASDLVDAVLNRRIVILDKDNSLVYGQKIWVDRYLELTKTAESAINNAESIIENLKNNGQDVGLSEMYIESAKNALTCWNPAKAIKLTENATSTLALGLDLSTNIPESVDPNETFDMEVALANNHTFAVSVNTSMYAISSLAIDHVNLLLTVPAESSGTATRVANADEKGFVSYWLNIHSFNTSEFLLPVLIRHRTIIDNVTWTIKESSSGYSATIMLMIDSDARREISTAWVTYDDGTGSKNAKMDKNFNWYEFTLGPYAETTNVTFHIEVTDIAGNTFILQERIVTIGPTAIAPLPIDLTTILVLVAGVGVVVVVVIVIVLKKNRI